MRKRLRKFRFLRVIHAFARKKHSLPNYVPHLVWRISVLLVAERWTSSLNQHFQILGIIVVWAQLCAEDFLDFLYYEFTIISNTRKNMKKIKHFFALSHFFGLSNYELSSWCPPKERKWYTDILRLWTVFGHSERVFTELRFLWIDGGDGEVQQEGETAYYCFFKQRCSMRRSSDLVSFQLLQLIFQHFLFSTRCKRFRTSATIGNFAESFRRNNLPLIHFSASASILVFIHLFIYYYGNRSMIWMWKTKCEKEINYTRKQYFIRHLHTY